MDSRTLLPLALAVALTAVPSGARSAEQLDGKKIFLAQKCDMCHSIAAAQIKATSKIKAPDLTGLATKTDATLLSRFLRRDVDIKGKKHLKPFTGSDEEVGALIAWLQKQTAAAKK